ncbi:hypothetical protein [Chitinophaga eiseniae]|uniref:Uncharacterized protein n=1 Tax=Chitinophaga eiseniae TaxID=634771 RepID=A0A847SIL9_9BACT|nr:hypothetical protein [Chitinophaga eiseniae]NLR77218.1 hypothetical protein [Chitinophaga eiseniae]
MEIVCTQTMSDHLLSNAVYLLIPLVLCSMGEAGIVFAVPALICSIIFGLGSRFVTTLRIQGNQLEVDYVKVFRRCTAHFNIADTVLEIRRYDELRHNGKWPTGPIYKYDWLHIIEHGKDKFYVDSRKGFPSSQFMILLQAFADAKARSGKN